jgi:hypothetical protein
MASRTASRLSVRNVLSAGALAGNAQSHLRPPADRTACGACENVRSRAVFLPVPTVDGPDRTSVTPPLDLHFLDSIRSRRRAFKQFQQFSHEFADGERTLFLPDSVRWP